MKVYVDIRPDHVTAGQPGKAEACPVALAVRELIQPVAGEPIVVTVDDEVRIEPDLSGRVDESTYWTIVAAIPDDLDRWITAYDRAGDRIAAFGRAELSFLEDFEGDYDRAGRIVEALGRTSEAPTAELGL
jgi:hypothetical protein